MLNRSGELAYRLIPLGRIAAFAAVGIGEKHGWWLTRRDVRRGIGAVARGVGSTRRIEGSGISRTILHGKNGETVGSVQRGDPQLGHGHLCQRRRALGLRRRFPPPERSTLHRRPGARRLLGPHPV